jgi:ATP-binding protein involved in chromosome partitioning
VNLALALARKGRHVAVVDADVWGFSIPAMLGIDHPPTLLDNRMILPPAAFGVTLASIGFFVAEDQPVVWRGPMLHKALEQFLSDFHWGEPDYLVVDMPPGTGDIAISLAGFLPTAEAYVVTTPQPAAQRVAQRAGLMFQSSHVKIPVRGVIENMSWFTGDEGKRYELFGAGGGADLAERLGVPLIGQVPLVQELREGGDEGRPIVAVDPDAEASQAFASIATWIDEHPPTKRRNAALKVT